MHRSLIGLPLAAALALIPVATAAAADPTLNLHAGVGIAGQSVNGGAWTATSAQEPCDSGNTTSGPTAYRCAFEFDLSSIPSGATITQVRLVFRTYFATYATVFPTDLGGYTGNGTAELADLTAGSKLVTFTPLYSGGASTWTQDVTSFVTGLLTAHSTWAGFNLSSTGTDDQQFWVGGGAGIDTGEPELIVDYTTASVSPSPSPSAASPSPSPSATSTVRPSTSPSPAGSVAGITQPPTDLGPTSTDPSATGALPAGIVLLAILSAIAFAVALPRRRRLRR